jgi:DNA-binding Xre family transcriptional regulator
LLGRNPLPSIAFVRPRCEPAVDLRDHRDIGVPELTRDELVGRAGPDRSDRVEVPRVVDAVVRELREQRGLSQQALGDLADVRQATISELESGKKQRLDFEILERLAVALNVEIGELLILERKGKRGR